MSSSANAYIISEKINRAVDKAKLLFERQRILSPPSDRDHTYDDKYGLADFLVNNTITSSIHVLQSLGATPEKLKRLREWSKDRDVSLRLESNETCDFIKEATRKVEDPKSYETKIGGSFGNVGITSKSYTSITEYFFRYGVEYRLIAVRGVGETSADVEVLQTRTANHEVVLRVKESPYVASKLTKFEVNISWALRHLNESDLSKSVFTINRNKDSCRTPRRNEDVEQALSAFQRINEWANQVANYFQHSVFQVERSHTATGYVAVDLSCLHSRDVFVSVVPLFEQIENDSSSNESQLIVSNNNNNSLVLSAYATNKLMDESERSLEQKVHEVSLLFPAKTTQALISAAEAALIVTLRHWQDIAVGLSQGVDYIEAMLRSQLIAAIGKEVQPADFAEYMKFHHRKLFLPPYQPKPFSFAVRRSLLHSPEGALRLEQTLRPGEIAEPVTTISSSRSSAESAPMQFVLNASTKVTFGGDRHLHALLLHSFSGHSLPALELVSEARQFSGYIVLVGRIVSASIFDPKFGIIVQNKDEIKIPLDLEQIPTAKEFKDAIKSLSPEQQRFAKAYRSMQLESTLFGVCVIQIKPQLEKVLKLFPDSLTKEIQLTQDLMEMFIKYQIPPDLLSFDGADHVDSRGRLEAVKRNVKAIQDMVKGTKDKEIEEERRKAQYNAPLAVDDLLTGSISRSSAPISSRGGDRNTKAPIWSADEGSSNKSVFSRFKSSSAKEKESGSKQLDNLIHNLNNNNNDINNKVSKRSEAIPNSIPTAATATATTVTPTSSVNKPQEQPQQQQEIAAVEEQEEAFDFTALPTQLEAAYEKLDVDSCLRPTIINPSNTWTKRSQAALLASPVTSTLNKDGLKAEKNAAFDLLDALSRSGGLTIEDATLHVVIAATHTFDKSVMDVVVQNNVNPIERVERSALIMASVVHDKSADLLLVENQRERVSTYSPQLFLLGDGKANASSMPLLEGGGL